MYFRETLGCDALPTFQAMTDDRDAAVLYGQRARAQIGAGEAAVCQLANLMIHRESADGAGRRR